jgi:alkylation response protein AidB-like acyl-CoA dehydrogenase
LFFRDLIYKIRQRVEREVFHMNFNFTGTQRDIIEAAAKFAQREIAPHVDADEAASFFRRELFPKAGAAGLLGISCPAELGGAELGAVEYALALEQIAYVSGGYATSISVSGMPLAILLNFGNEEQKQRYMPALIAGEKIGAFCLTEPGAGSDAAALRATAVKKGDRYVLNGVKHFITNGTHADTFAILARTSAAGAEGISCFLAERGMPGLKGGKVEKKMGMRVSPIQEIILENLEVPAENLVGKEGEGFLIAKRTLDGGRISMGTVANGISRAALDIAVKYAKEREQFGKPLSEFQGISFLLADMATELEASRLLVLQAAALKDEAKRHTLQASMAKLKATEACMRITTDAVQVLGGYGYMEEFRVERYMREAKMLQLVEGTSQIQRLIIARHL